MSRPVHVIVYRITGRQLFFKIPEHVCEECDISVAVVQRVVEEIKAEDRVQITVKPWINNLVSCLFWRSWHPPVITINGKRFSQGVVPDKPALTEAIRNQLNNAKT